MRKTYLELLEKGNYVEAVEEFVNTRDNVTFIELQEFLGRKFITKGTYSMDIPEHNIIIWAGMSKEFIDIMEQVRVRGNVSIDGTSYFVYLCDGGVLRLPIAKRPSKKRPYKTPHWAPAVLRRKVTSHEKVKGGI